MVYDRIAALYNDILVWWVYRCDRPLDNYDVYLRTVSEHRQHSDHLRRRHGASYSIDAEHACAIKALEKSTLLYEPVGHDPNDPIERRHEDYAEYDPGSDSIFFVIKQDNNGTTYILSPNRLPGLLRGGWDGIVHEEERVTLSGDEYDGEQQGINRDQPHHA